MQRYRSLATCRSDRICPSRQPGQPDWPARYNTQGSQMPPLSRHCASIGFPLRNVRWSWAAASRDGARMLFTVWRDEVRHGKYIIYPVTERRPGKMLAAANDQLGAREARRLAEVAATDAGIQTYGIECVAGNTTTPKRTRKSFDRSSLLQLRIERDGRGCLVANILGSVPHSTWGSREQE